MSLESLSRKTSFSLKLSALCLLAANIAGCLDNSSQTLDDELRAVISAHALTGDPTLGKTITTIDDPLSQLGMKLFLAKPWVETKIRLA